MVFTSTLIHLGKGIGLNPFDKQEDTEIKSLLNFISTACYNIHGCTETMIERKYNDELVHDMKKLLAIASILGLKWQNKLEGNDVNIDFDITRGDHDE